MSGGRKTLSQDEVEKISKTKESYVLSEEDKTELEDKLNTMRDGGKTFSQDEVQKEVEKMSKTKESYVLPEEDKTELQNKVNERPSKWWKQAKQSSIGSETVRVVGNYDANEDSEDSEDKDVQNDDLPRPKQ
jgi:hypothetical protein